MPARGRRSTRGTESAAYAFQIYFDFSGYSDMAIGLGLMIGFVFAKNFDSPYRSQSITEFWRRWHISLSAWLRDYLYVPLGGSRKGPGRTYVNLFIVMLLGGLWHGAAWTFVIWGAIHGTLLAIERMSGKSAIYRGIPAPARIAATFGIVLITWVFFRAASVPDALQYLADMAGLGVPHPGAGLLSGIVYQPYYLGTFLAGGRGRVDRASVVGLGVGADAPPSRRRCGAALPVGRRADDAGLQPVHLFHLLMLLPTRGLVVALFVISAVWPRIIGANRALMEYMESFERRIEQESAIGKALRPRAQQLMTAWLGAGNERVYPGRDGWLFYRPDVEYVTGRGFLEDREFERRVLSASEWTTPPQPDPVLAIVHFKRELEARNIALVVMPTPVKPVIHPEGLAVGPRGTVRNASFARFTAALAQAGVAVFDPADELSRGTGDKYLRTDTHWRPEAMEAVAARLARFIEARWPVVRGRFGSTACSRSRCSKPATSCRCWTCRMDSASIRRNRSGCAAS